MVSDFTLQLEYSSNRYSKATVQDMESRKKGNFKDLKGALKIKGFNPVGPSVEDFEGLDIHKTLVYVLDNIHKMILGEQPLLLALSGEDAELVAALIAKEAIPYYYNCHSISLSALYDAVYERENQKESEKGRYIPYHEYMGCDLLCINDFESIRTMTENKKAYIFQMLKERISRDMPVILCSTIRFTQLQSYLEDKDIPSEGKIQAGSFYARLNKKFNIRHVGNNFDVKAELP